LEKVVIFSDLFHQSLEELVEILYDEDYFGFKIDCHLYVDKIYDFIESNIDYPISRNSPESFQKYGKKYLRYKANNHTFWYIFFDEKDNRFLINHILNNHSKDFPELL
jgi:hypothetical protein